MYDRHIFWSESDTSCGVGAINRPCQKSEASKILEGSYPQNAICEAEGETVYILDDDTEILAELRELIEWCGYAVRCFANSHDFQRMDPSSFRGCVILDIRLRASCGTEIQAWLKQNAPDIPVIFVSGVATLDTAVACMRAGAIEFLPKPVEPNDLRRAISSAIGLSRMLKCKRESVNEVTQRLEVLTPTELQIAHYVAKGYPSKKIANIFNRSANTVKIHKSSIFKKLNINSSVDLAKIWNFVR